MASLITVVGAGVIGLTTGLRLQEEGFEVRIVAREPPTETTSAVAAAIWFPYKAYPRNRVVEWGRKTLDYYHSIADTEASGVSLVELIDLREERPANPWWSDAGVKYRRANRRELHADYEGGFTLQVPLIEAPIHLSYLAKRFENSGGEIEIRPNGVDSLSHLPGIVVNCAGLGAKSLASDESVFPIRGQVVRVTNPGLERCLVDDEGPRGLSYVIPRSGDCVLGGTAEKDRWDLEPDETSTRQILARCRELEPRLHDAEVLDVKVGLRPARPAIRVEKVTLPSGQTLIHNYGHGGSGYTLAKGCADEVAKLLR